MHTATTRLGAIALAIASLGLAATTADARPRLTGEEELAKIIQDRVPGKPTDCISQFDGRDMQVIDKTALVYRSGGTIWVNRPADPHSLDSDDILVTYPTGSQFCRLDRVQTVDRSGHFVTGFVMLGDFVPYRRAAATD
ncbi:MAG: hypothetical protein JSR96_04100 [Proteobacteria bacterium]|nr:hypothetical protein [Pseudomonadota bacterium]